MLDPVLFANLCGSRLTADQLSATIDALAAGDPEGVTPAFVRRVAAEIVQRQVRAGITVVNDGEMSKPSYATYVKGFESRPNLLNLDHFGRGMKRIWLDK